MGAIASANKRRLFIAFNGSVRMGSLDNGYIVFFSAHFNFLHSTVNWMPDTAEENFGELVRFSGVVFAIYAFECNNCTRILTRPGQRRRGGEVVFVHRTKAQRIS